MSGKELRTKVSLTILLHKFVSKKDEENRTFAHLEITTGS